MKRMIGMLMVLLGMMGCVGNYEYVRMGSVDHVSDKEVKEIWVDSRFNVIESEGIGRSVSEWNKVFNGQVVMEMKRCEFVECKKKYKESVEIGSGVVVLKLSSDDPLVEDMDLDGVLAFVPRKGAHLMVVVSDHIGKKELRGIVLHEFGHIFGAEHLKIEGSLMYPEWSRKQGDCVDKVTAKVASEYMGLDFSKMRYCKVPALEF